MSDGFAGIRGPGYGSKNSVRVQTEVLLRILTNLVGLAISGGVSSTTPCFSEGTVNRSKVMLLCKSIWTFFWPRRKVFRL